MGGFSENNTEETAPKRRGRKPGSISAPKQTEVLAKIRTTLEVLFGTASALTIASGNPVLIKDGHAIASGAPNLINSILILCQQDKNVRAFFISLSTGSAYANVMISAMPIVIAILSNHGLIPPIFGTPVPIPNSVTNGIDTLVNTP